MKLALLSITLTAAIGAVCAQAVISPCVLGCLFTAQSSGACGIGEFSTECMCTSTEFKAVMHDCLVAECTAADQENATALDEQFCGQSDS
ncbi:hypothetical protein LXA43DRAFT_1097961 [Ganoderma leucocontextum]|nr:hypothetical protein LXA43DRAFT_1097961 [Ganoderma leucocontextum]